MAPTFLSLKDLRRRSKASFRTENSTDTSSDGALSHDTHDTPSSGSLTPPSMAHQSDPALNLQVKDASGQNPAQAPTRPMLAPAGNSSRYSVSGMTGLGSPSPNGRSNLPVSQYAPRVQNISENAWVRRAQTLEPAVSFKIGLLELLVIWQQKSCDGTC